MSFPPKTPRRARALIPTAAALAATLAIAACGSSSTSTTSSTTSTTASASTATGSSANRTALFACLKKHGVTPPAHVPSGGTPGTRTAPPPAGAPGAGGAGGAGSSARQAAFKACGATGHFPGAGTTPAG
jgi:hypothetical protein